MAAREIQIDMTAAARMYAEGASVAAVAKAFGLSRFAMAARLGKAGVKRRTASEAVQLMWRAPGHRDQMSELARERYARTGTDMIAKPPVPRWVPGDLVDDFIDHARLWGEEAAASHCRRLKREAEACL
jgi:hypothetical protein